jgi:hypothetical protein
MNNQIVKLLMALTFVIALILGLAAYKFRFWGSGDQPIEPTLHYQYVWFIDQSISVDPSGQPQWQKATEEQVKRIRCGDTLFMFGLHNQTRQAAPIYNDEVPAVSDDPTIIEDKKCKLKLVPMRQQLKDKFREAFDLRHRAIETDYFSSIDRIKLDQTRRTMVFFVGDMVQSNRELDLERVRLTEENIVDLLNQVIAKHGWQRDQLNGVRVHCLLNSLNIREAAPLNDVRILRKFWETLFQSLGAELVTFDTHLSVKQSSGQ